MIELLKIVIFFL